MKSINVKGEIVDRTAEDIVSSLTNGTSLQGEINMEYVALVNFFGEPTYTEEAGDKTDAEWIIMTPDGIATIYNYKDGKNYNGEDGLATKDIHEWHIGGHSKAVVEHIIKASNPF